MRPLAFSLELQSMAALASVLTHTARLGGQVTYLQADAGRVHLRVLAPLRCVHRFAPQLERLVEVIALRELPHEPEPHSPARTTPSRDAFEPSVSMPGV